MLCLYWISQCIYLLDIHHQTRLLTFHLSYIAPQPPSLAFSMCRNPPRAPQVGAAPKPQHLVLCTSTPIRKPVFAKQLAFAAATCGVSLSPSSQPQMANMLVKTFLISVNTQNIQQITAEAVSALCCGHINGAGGPREFPPPYPPLFVNIESYFITGTTKNKLQLPPRSHPRRALSQSPSTEHQTRSSRVMAGEVKSLKPQIHPATPRTEDATRKPCADVPGPALH